MDAFVLALFALVRVMLLWFLKKSNKIDFDFVFVLGSLQKYVPA
jgi:hypothetical protein